ncbi:MAG: cupredoxin domain-containing protein [Actinomycetota bacterium]
MSGRPTRDRLLLPVLLPLGILVVLGVALVGFAQVLLAVTPLAATATALAVAASVVVVSAVAAGRREIRAATVASMVGAVAGVAMLAGGAALLLAARPAEEGGEGERITIALAAENILFGTDALDAPAGVPFAIAFDNRDAGIPHNVEIFDNAEYAGEPLWKGELVTGPMEVVYDVPALAAGSYWFNCVVHPTMVGTLEATEGGGEAAEGPTVVADMLAFDTTTIALAADTPTVIVLDNREAGIPHNISIYDAAGGDPLYRGELVTGPVEVEYALPPLPAGTYVFRCDVHPTMAGEVVVT